MLKNMKTRNSLLLGYGITIGISVILILICLLMMLNIKGKYDVLLDKDAAANQDILYCRVNALLVGRNIRDSILSPVLRPTRGCSRRRKKRRPTCLPVWNR